MTRSLAISQRQAQTLIRAADAEQAIVEVKVGEAIFRLIPKSRAEDLTSTLDESAKPETFRTLDEYKAWRDKRGRRG
ncbi:hypothetical protein CK222_30790 [Mesorhizobium sp. WSM3866]|nr:hypothetical protein CK222_30790 [Mesorhizobium sp. WSM3866]